MTLKNDLSENNAIEIYCEILLGILRYIPVKNYYNDEEYLKAINKNLKFEGKYDHKTLRSCIDLIEDNQLAIKEFNENGLLTSESKNFGEIYLRLYGILNSGYLQYQSIIELIELFKIQNKKDINKDFKKLIFLEIRNKVGSHTPKWTHNKNNFKSYRVARNSLSKWANNIIIVSNFGELEEYNLINELYHFNQLSELYLDKIVEKGINSLFPNNSKNKKWMTDRLYIAREKRACVENK